MHTHCKQSLGSYELKHKMLEKCPHNHLPHCFSKNVSTCTTEKKKKRKEILEKVTKEVFSVRNMEPPEDSLDYHIYYNRMCKLHEFHLSKNLDWF